MSEVIRDVIIRIGLQQKEAKLKAPDVSDAVRAEQRAQSEAKATAKAQEDARKAAEKSAREAAKAQEKARRDLEQFSQAAQTENLKVADSFKRAGEGAFILARGVAFLSSSSDDDLRKMLATVAKVQGAFDLFKGSVDTVKAVSDGIRAMRAASAATAAANTALAASNAAVATTATAASVATGGLLATLGPIALAATAVGAAFLFFRSSKKDGDEFTETVYRAGRGVNRLVVEANNAARAMELLDLASGLDVERLDNAAKLAALRGRELSVVQEIEMIQSAAATREAGIVAARRGKSVEELREVLVIAKESTAITREDIRIAEALKGITEARKNATLRTLEAQGREAAFLQQQIAGAKELLRISEERIKAEENRVKSAKERFGDLDLEKQRELVRIAQKPAESRSLEEQRELAQFGGSKAEEELAATRRQRAEAAGFGTFDKATGLSSDLDRVRRESAPVVDSANAALDDLRKAVEKNRENQLAQRKVFEALLNQLDQNARDISELESRIEDRKQRFKNAEF